MKNIIAFLLLIAPLSILAQWQGTNPIYYNTGNIGIGTATPSVWFGTKTLEFSDVRPVFKLSSTSATGLSTIIFTNSYVNSVSHLGEFHINHQFDQTNNDKSLLRFGSYPATEIMALQANGKVGIGTTAPLSRLSIFNGAGAGKNTDGLDGSLLYLNNGTLPDGSIVIKSHGVNQVIGALKFHSSPDYDNYSQAAIKALAGPYAEASALAFYTSNSNTQQVGSEVMRIQGANVGIGTTNPNQKLTVNGTIYGKEVKVDLNVPGPDYVFEPSYKLPSLTEIETYIKANKHLPEVPSAKEMEANGINLSEMNMLLLKKVEELTLHLIEQQKQLHAQQELIEKLIKK
jgi:hypothetical protein